MYCERVVSPRYASSKKLYETPKSCDNFLDRKPFADILVTTDWMLLRKPATLLTARDNDIVLTGFVAWSTSSLSGFDSFLPFYFVAPNILPLEMEYSLKYAAFIMIIFWTVTPVSTSSLIIMGPEIDLFFVMLSSALRCFREQRTDQERLSWLRGLHTDNGMS